MMNDTFEYDERSEEPSPSGMPIDLTKEEFIEYHMTIGRLFGTLRLQKPSMIFFALYMVIILVFLISHYLQTATIDWLMLFMLGVTLATAVLVLTLTPRRIRKHAVKLYDAGDINGYYGEIVITRTEITKILGDDCVSIPLNERTAYLEDRGFMAFSTVGGQKAIILPARCMTPDAAKQVREAVFADGCRVTKRVVKRMEAKATAPIDRRALQQLPQMQYTVSVNFEPDEVKKQLTDMHWQQYVQSLPSILTLAVVIGTLMAVLEENLIAFFAATLFVILGMLGLSMLGARSKAKRVAAAPQQMRMVFELSDQGLHYRHAAAPHASFIRWQSVERAVERPDCVEFCGADQFIRIPKRCIADMDELRTVVDRYRQPKNRQ